MVLECQVMEEAVNLRPRPHAEIGIGPVLLLTAPP